MIIVLLQSAPLLGVAPASSPLGAVLALPGVLANLNGEALLLGGLTLLIVFRTPMAVSRIEAAVSMAGGL